MKKHIYLDYGATTPLDSRVVQSMAPFWSEQFGNPSSMHSWGQTGRNAVEKAREIVAVALCAGKDEIFFTSGGTEANNLAVMGTARKYKDRGKHLITTVIEHHSVLKSFNRLEQEGFQVTYLPVTESGIVEPKTLMEALLPDTILVSIMHSNNEIGTIQAIEDLSKILQERKVFFHVDGVQYFPHFPVDLSKLKVDLYSISAHKMYGPKGIGALYIKKDVLVEPLLLGGEQEKGVRAGTENLPAIVGFGAAVKLLMEERDNNTRQTISLRDKFIYMLTSNIEGCYINGDPVRRLPNNVNVSFNGVEGETLVINLDLEGVACSSGSACTAGAVEPSHVLSAIGKGPEFTKSSVRFTLGKFSTLEEIECSAEIVCKLINKMRSLKRQYACG